MSSVPFYILQKFHILHRLSPAFSVRFQLLSDFGLTNPVLSGIIKPECNSVSSFLSMKSINQKGVFHMLQLAAVFSDHMVLQREKNIVVFGIGEVGAIITVSIPERKL